MRFASLLQGLKSSSPRTRPGRGPRRHFVPRFEVLEGRNLPSTFTVLNNTDGGPDQVTVTATGDLQTGAHHTVEDVGICIGQALDHALGDRSGISRYGDATVPMDEARAACAIDVSGRGLCAFEASLPPGSIGNFDHELTEEFIRALALNAKLTLHLTIEAGSNVHHMIEASFKALARALRMAVALDPEERGVPSTKGTLT